MLECDSNFLQSDKAINVRSAISKYFLLDYGHRSDIPQVLKVIYQQKFHRLWNITEAATDQRLELDLLRFILRMSNFTFKSLDVQLVSLVLLALITSSLFLCPNNCVFIFDSHSSSE